MYVLETLRVRFPARTGRARYTVYHDVASGRVAQVEYDTPARVTRMLRADSLADWLSALVPTDSADLVARIEGLGGVVEGSEQRVLSPLVWSCLQDGEPVWSEGWNADDVDGLVALVTGEPAEDDDEAEEGDDEGDDEGDEEGEGDDEDWRPLVHVVLRRDGTLSVVHDQEGEIEVRCYREGRAGLELVGAASAEGVDEIPAELDLAGPDEPSQSSSGSGGVPGGSGSRR